jgi:hypothetical protein
MRVVIPPFGIEALEAVPPRRFSFVGSARTLTLPSPLEGEGMR